MIREVILEATGQVSDTPTGSAQTSRDPGGSPYPWNNTPTKTLAECWSDADDATYWYMWPHKDLGGEATALASFAAPPTLVLIRSVKIQAYWSYSQSGPDNWYFPVDNAWGPRARLVIRNRAKSGNLYSGYRTLVTPGDAAVNDNINTHLGYTGPLLQEWETTAHPEGGPWTIDDLSVANFAAGISLEGDAPSFDNTQGSFFKIRVHRLRVLLSVEDLGGYVDNIRHAGAMILRLMRRARNTVPLRYYAARSVAAVGERVYMSHPRGGPSVLPGGWGRRRLERRPGQVLKRVIYPEVCKYEDEVFDLEAYRCLAWAAYRIDAPWSPELQGLALLEKGGGYTHTRAQDGWSQRPGDGVLMRVIEAYPPLSFHGLAAQGGGDDAICPRNYDLMQAGWVATGAAGAFTIAASTSRSLVEEQGYLSSALLTYGALGGQGGRGQWVGALPFASGDFLHVRVIVQNTSVTTPGTQFLEARLMRQDGGLAAPEYWDESARAWTAVVTDNPIPSDEPFGEVIFDAIPCDAAGAASDPNYYVYVGRFSSNIASCSFNAALVDVQYAVPATAASYGARTPLVTLDATISRVADVHRYPNTTGAEVWSYERGTAVVEAQPFWRAEAMPNNEVKPLVHAYHAVDTYDAIQFVSKVGSDDLVRFERAVSGEATFQLDAPIVGLDLTRAHVLRAWARWLGADGWKEYGPWSVEVGFAVFLEADGSLVQTGSALGTFAYQGNVATREWVGAGNDSAARFADAYVRMIEVRRNPLAGLEATWRV